MALEVFSTGIVRVSAVGTAGAPADALAYVQSFSFEASEQEKKLFSAAHLSRYAEKVAFFGAMAKAKFTTKDLNLVILAALGGHTVSTPSAGRKLITGKKTDVRGFRRMEYEGQDLNGTPVKIVFFRAYSLTTPLSYSLDDFGDYAIDMEGLPAEAAAAGASIGDVWTIEAAG